MKFLCSSCGACCQAISCPYLSEDNRCTIYDTRPDICNVEKQWQIKGGENQHDQDAKLSYLIENTLACHRLIDLMGLSEDYKIDILDYVENNNGQIIKTT